VAGLTAFILAAGSALLVNLPLAYEAVTPDDIEGRLQEDPIRSSDRAEKDVALTQVKALRDAKAKNSFKGWCLFVAIVLEVVAVVGVAVCIVISP
jgi:hypothetical protein